MHQSVANGITRLAEWLAVTIGVAPTGARACRFWIRGFVDGYLERPYGRRHRRRTAPRAGVTPASDSYRQGFVYGQAQRMPRN